MRTSSSIPLIIEPHPDDYRGYEFITLIRYNDQNLLNIIDNYSNKQLTTYVLDFCTAANVSEEQVINLASEWYYSGRHKRYPLSIEISKLGLADELAKILRVFPVDYISRVIGPMPEYKMDGVIKIKKKKRKPIPKGMEFIDKRTFRGSV